MNVTVENRAINNTSVRASASQVHFLYTKCVTGHVKIGNISVPVLWLPSGSGVTTSELVEFGV